MADTIRVLSRVACTFRDTEGNVLYTVGPRDKFVIREAPAAIRNDPLFGWLQGLLVVPFLPLLVSLSIMKHRRTA